LAQLSLIWPYNIVDYDTKKTLLSQIEKHLVGAHGVTRYPGDTYCGKGLHPGNEGPAQWPLGLAWLAICYAKFAELGRDFDMARKPVHFTWEERKEFFGKALEYFSLLERNMTPEGAVPEMYVGNQAGHNTPLAWAQSFHIVAAQSLLNLAHAHPTHFKIPTQVRFGNHLKT
jgi:GH15 family glucan-1,4-alpha-glucosidase